MALKIEDQGDRLTEGALSGLEKQLKAKLPAEYRRFLLESNGGLPSPDIVDIEGLPGGMADVQVFFRLGGPVESSDLIWNKAMFSDRIAGRLLPVACDSGGSLFCLSLADEDEGTVIYVDLQSIESTCYVVAESFDRFLGRLRAWRV